ncbi:GntR family transcriptional regulator [Dactylosporangium cerinum]
MGIDRGSPTPVYVQLAELLRDQISAGRYTPGSALPPEDGIGRWYGVGRMSVRRALAMLRHEGLIVTERGTPVSVRLQPPRMFLELADTDQLIARMPTRQEAQHLGVQVGVPLLQVVRADGSEQTFPRRPVRRPRCAPPLSGRRPVGCTIRLHSTPACVARSYSSARYASKVSAPVTTARFAEHGEVVAAGAGVAGVEHGPSGPVFTGAGVSSQDVTARWCPRAGPV